MESGGVGEGEWRSYGGRMEELAMDSAGGERFGDRGRGDSCFWYVM